MSTQLNRTGLPNKTDANSVFSIVDSQFPLQHSIKPYLLMSDIVGDFYLNGKIAQVLRAKHSFIYSTFSK